MSKFLLAFFIFCLSGCSSVYTKEDFPDINTVPDRPQLKDIAVYEQEYEQLK